MYLSFQEKQRIFQINNQRREALLEEAQQQNSPSAKIQFVADYFLNKLPKETICKIDGTSKSSFKDFKYDYSYLDDMKSEHIRQQSSREYAPGAKAETLSAVDDFRVGNEHIAIFPTVFTLKMATCIIFANEIQRFCHELGIESKIVQELTHCYDKFDGKSTEGKTIHTDQIVKMMHYYNIITIDGVDYKLDLAGALTTLEFNKNHPEHAIDPNLFYFSTELETKPYTALAESNPPKIKNINLVFNPATYGPN